MAELIAISALLGYIRVAGADEARWSDKTRGDIASLVTHSQYAGPLTEAAVLSELAAQELALKAKRAARGG